MSNLDRQYQRRLKRHQISGAVEVYDTNRNVYLGRLANLHEEGLMLVGDDGAMEPDHVYQIDLQLPDTQAGASSIHLGVDCLWARPSGDASVQWTGCHIIDRSEVALGQIQALIQQLGGGLGD